MLFAAIGIIASASAFAANLVLVGPAYAELKSGLEISGNFEYLCSRLAPDTINNEKRRVLDTKYKSFFGGTEGASSNRLSCGAQTESYKIVDGVPGWYLNDNGGYTSYVLGPIYCKSGGLFREYTQGCYIIQ